MYNQTDSQEQQKHDEYDPGLLKYFQDKEHKQDLMMKATLKVKNLESFKILQTLLNSKHTDKKQKINEIQQEYMSNLLVELSQCTFQGTGFQNAVICYQEKTEQCKLDEKQNKDNKCTKNWEKAYQKCNKKLDRQFNQCFNKVMVSNYDKIYREAIEELEGKNHNLFKKS